MSCDTCVKHHDYYSENISTWCTNCGNYAIDVALKQALVAEQIAPQDVLLCYDIGCNGNGADKMGGYRFHGLHGRVIPFACGAALANRNIPVIASAGDGATLSEGINHLIHAIRHNYNITFILHNNENYGLTVGQASATTPKGVPMAASPDGVDADPINVMSLVLSLGATFAARTYSGSFKQMKEIIRAGIKHQGFSFIEILQDCPTFNKATPHNWYLERIYDTLFVPGYDNRNLKWAQEIAGDLSEKIATGILYHNPDKADFYANQVNRVDVKTELVNEVTTHDIVKLMSALR